MFGIIQQYVLGVTEITSNRKKGTNTMKSITINGAMLSDMFFNYEECNAAWVIEDEYALKQLSVTILKEKAEQFATMLGLPDSYVNQLVDDYMDRI